MTFTSLYHGGYDVYLIKNATELPGLELQPTNFRLHGSPKPLEVSEKGPEPRPEATLQSPESGRPYTRYVFTPSGQAVPETTKVHAADTVNTRIAGGGFWSKKYKVHFTPDFVFATAAYSSFFGAQGTGQILFSDVLGDQMIYVNTDLYTDFRNLDNTNFAVQYFYLPRRINYGIEVFRYTYYLPINNLPAPYDTLFQDQTLQLQASAAYPFSKYTRLQLDLNGYAINRSLYSDSTGNFTLSSLRRILMPALSYIHDTSIGNIIGPSNGVRYKLTAAYSPRLGPVTDKRFEEFYTVKGDYRQYFRLARDISLASRITMGLSGGPDPQDFFVGGVSNWINRRFENNQIPSDIDNFYFSNIVTPFRGADYFQRNMTGHRFFLMNQEVRFPFVEDFADAHSVADHAARG